MIKNKITLKLISRPLFLLIIFGFTLAWPRQVDTANLTDVRDTLATSRLSYHAVLASGNTANSTQITIDTGSTAPNTDTNGLHVGDAVYIGTSGSNPYTVASIIDNDQFTISSALNAADDDAGDNVYVKRHAQHVVTFTTVSAINDGAFLIRVPVATANYNDTYPDATGFDMNSITNADISPPNDGNGYTFGTDAVGVGTSFSDGYTCPSGYVCFHFPYTGTGTAGVGFTGPSGNDFRLGDGTTDLLNPAPASGHSQGTADTYTVVVENLNSGGTAIDSTTLSIGVIESVRVTATVDPSITFTIGSRATGTTACGNDADITTNAYSVPFGSLTLDTFANAAQALTVSTNAASGYVVTAQEDDQMGKDGGTSPFIQDTTCAASACTQSSSQDWTSAANYPGLGYSLEEVTAGAAAFEYDDSGSTFYARQFAADADTEDPVTVMSGSTVASSEQIYVCYRIAVTSSQQAGDYENLVTYTATGRF